MIVNFSCAYTSFFIRNLPSPWAKNSLKECVFVNSTLKIQCHIVKCTFLQTVFSAILPTGLAKKSSFKEILENF